jgi:mannose-1-phosphate guanylyltransferase
MLIPVILSGGAGTRLWPVSRSAYPKPFMRMADGETLLYKTLERALRVAAGGSILTVTGRDYYFLTRDEYARHPQADLDRLPFLLEPAGRNTAPAVVLAALYAREQIDPAATLLVLPADHLIADVAAFLDDAHRAAALAEQGWLVTFGIKPTQPETGFGYIRMGAAISEVAPTPSPFPSFPRTRGKGGRRGLRPPRYRWGEKCAHLSRSRICRPPRPTLHPASTHGTPACSVFAPTRC